MNAERTNNRERTDRHDHANLPTVAIVGLGLIGGSLALNLRAAEFDVRAFDVSRNTREAAADAGITTYPTLDALLEDLPNDAVLFLATPLPQAIALLPAIAELTDESVTVSDVVSVKIQFLQAIQAAGLANRYVGAHPMAGTTESGFGAASADLLPGATWVVTLEECTDLDRWLAVCDVALAVGGRVVAADAEWHDHATAWISHLPHVLAELLASYVEPRSLAGALAAGSYRDATRVAQTRPELVEAMLAGNRRMLTEALEEFLDQLEQATIGVRDGEVAGLIERGHHNRTRWQARKDATAHEQVEIEIAGDIRGRLIELGSRGAFIVSHHDGRLTALT